MKQIAAMLFVLLSVLSLSACSVRTAYNNFDRLTLRWVNQQVSLDAPQQQLLRDFLAEELDWHCATQLTDYQAWIEQLRMDVLAERLDQARLAEHGQSVAQFGRILSDRTLPILVDLAASLDDDQVEQLLAAVAERTEKIRVTVEYTTQEELATKRLESMERSLRRLMGRSNRAQQERLATWAHSITATQSYQLNQRLYWHGRLAAALERRDEREILAAEIADLLRPQSAWPDAYRAVMEGNRRLTLDALEDVLRLADQRQVNRISARLSGLRSDFQRLSCEGTAPPELLAAT